MPSNKQMIEGFLEAFEYAIKAGDAEECAKQFVIWTKHVASGLYSSNMRYEYEQWTKAQKEISFYSDEPSFPAQAESMKAILIGFLQKNTAFIDQDRIVHHPI